ncbi:hypothetical protein GMI70_07900 [Eggerthellaceae bacterium zg-893]|nr:hypothetical protein [Eggerthellaceae bacterium zg-893]
MSLCVAGAMATSMVGVAAVQALGEGAGTALAAVRDKLSNSLVYDAVYGVSDQGLAVMEKHGDFTTDSRKTVHEVASFDVIDSKGNVVMPFGEKDLGSNESHAYGSQITSFAKLQEELVGNSLGLVVLIGHDEEGETAYAVGSRSREFGPVSGIRCRRGRRMDLRWQERSRIRLSNSRIRLSKCSRIQCFRRVY